MAIIAQPIGDIDQSQIIPDNYAPDNFREGWYFKPHNFPYYQFISADYDPNIQEVFEQNGKIYVSEEGFKLFGNEFPNPSGVPFFHPSQNYFIYPSGVAPYLYGRRGSYWELFPDLDNPYLFVPWFDPNTYGELVHLFPTKELPVITKSLPIVQEVLPGLMFLFKERVVEDSSTTLPIKEKIISRLTCDIQLLAKGKIKIIWDGDEVDKIEILKRGISEKEYGEPIQEVPFEQKQYITDIDDNSYVFTVRGKNGTGISLNEVTIGLSGLTTISANVDLGDFIKIYEVDMSISDGYEVEFLL